MKNFLVAHKRAIIIVLIALIIMGTAYYFTLGKGDKEGDAAGDTGSSSDSGSTGSDSTGASGFPLKWGMQNSNTIKLQNRLNLSIACCSGTKLSADGMLGQKTLDAIKRSFPTIGANVERTRVVSQAEFNAIINSKPSCA